MLLPADKAESWFFHSDVLSRPPDTEPPGSRPDPVTAARSSRERVRPERRYLQATGSDLERKTRFRFPHREWQERWPPTNS